MRNKHINDSTEHQELLRAYQAQLDRNRELEAQNEQMKIQFSKLEKYNNSLQEFAYMAAHDLKEPLRTIGSYASLIKRRYKNRLDEDGSQFLSFITDGINRMHNMLNEVVNYSGLDTTAEEENHEWFDTKTLVEELQQSLQQQIKEKNATIIIEDLPQIKADRNHLIQVFQNLISNGLKYNNHSQPSIRIDCKKKDGYYIFGVADNGIGIDMTFKDKIFEVFQRLHGKETYEGTGIGLAICKKLIDQYGGEIWVESNSGKGSRFCFSLPLVQAQVVGAA